MTISKIIKRINEELAGELLTYGELETFLDQVIDDINHQLDSKFPAFSDFSAETYPDRYPDYNFFPEEYIRNVVIKGAAYKFYVMDEEGIPTAQMFQYNYQDQLFYMLRDYLEYVPEEFKKDGYSAVRLWDVAWKEPWVRYDGL